MSRGCDDAHLQRNVEQEGQREAEELPAVFVDSLLGRLTESADLNTGSHGQIIQIPWRDAGDEDRS